jgi:2-dehydropantoate 2-reductase
MRVAVVGAGAIGTLIGHGLCNGGHEVTLLDLSGRVAQIRAAAKLQVIGEDGIETNSKPALVTTNYGEAGIVDVVILATKSQDLPEAATGVMQLINRDSVIVTVQNGIPWWYLYNLQSEFGGQRIHCLDPDRILEKTIPLSQVIGCVAYPAAIMESDGRVRHVEGRRFPVGELDGATTDRVEKVSRLFEDGGFKSRIIDDIRSEVWLKAWGALSINPVSALTRATMVDICTFSYTRDLIRKMMEEAMQVAEAFGASFRHTIEDRIEGARAVGAHKTSMLQDVECGRPIELDAVMLSVIELASMAGISTPTIQSIYSCTALVNENLIQNDAERISKAS